MAAQSMQQPARVQIATGLENRNDTGLNAKGQFQDAQVINAYLEQTADEEYWVEKRPGLLVQSIPGGNGNGDYNWLGNVYAVFGSTLLKNGVSLGAVDNSNGTYRFVQTLGAPARLVLGNGVATYYTDGTTLTQITDAVFVANQPYVKGFAYLDGTLYVMTKTAAIYGTQSLDDPTVWNALNFIIARIEPDLGVCLAKQLVYVIALKQWTTEVFYDANNPSPASPLGPVQGAKAAYGCASADSVQEIDDTLFWATATRAASPQIAMMGQLQLSIISTPAIDRLLKKSTFAQVYSWTLKVGGHQFYGLTLIDANITLVFDIGQRKWYRWTDSNGNYWPVTGVTFDSSNHHLIQSISNGKMYYLDGDYNYPNDDGTITPVDIVSQNATFGIDRNKTLNQMRFNADQTSGSILMVSVSDDDYQTWSNPRAVDLGKVRPTLDNCGSFYRRAWHYHHSSNTPLRIRSTDLQMDIGSK